MKRRVYENIAGTSGSRADRRSQRLQLQIFGKLYCGHDRRLRQGADYLEIDIQLTKDRVPVVYHDVRLETKTDLSGYVHEFDLQVLKEHVSGLCTLQEAMEWGCLCDAKEKNPKIQIGLTVPFVPADPVELMRSMDALVYLSDVYNMTPKIIEDLKQNGYYVSGAILREERWVRRVGELGVTMFESDDPGQVKELLSV